MEACLAHTAYVARYRRVGIARRRLADVCARKVQVQRLAAERDALKAGERKDALMRSLKETSVKLERERKAAADAQEQLSAKISALEGERDQLKSDGAVLVEG